MPDDNDNMINASITNNDITNNINNSSDTNDTICTDTNRCAFVRSGGHGCCVRAWSHAAVRVNGLS